MRDHIIFYSGARWEATGGGQRPRQLALRMRVPGKQIVHLAAGEVFNDGEPTIDEGVLVASPLRIAPEIIEDSIAICCLPSVLYAHALQQASTIIYDCIDHWEGFPHCESWYSNRLERWLFKEADIVTASAQGLVDFCNEFRSPAKLPPVLLRNGGPAGCYPDHPVPPAMHQGKKTIICVSCIGAEWWDWAAVHEIDEACLRYGWKQLLLGVVEPLLPNSIEERKAVCRAAMFGLKATEFPGQIGWQHVGRWLVNADAAIIPFKDCRVTQYVDPIKYYENVAAGLHTVFGAGLKEMHGRPYAMPAGTNEWAASLKQAVQRPRFKDAGQVKADSWELRAEVLSNLVREVL